jgi:hypothetical protein
MNALLVVVLVILVVLLAIVGLLAILFFVGYRKKVAAQGGQPSRFAAYQGTGCQHVPGHIYKQPDPMIYSQQYLLSKGLAVTWENPDVHLELGGVEVDSSDLKPNTTYDVVARIWNNSLDAVVVGMPVNFSFLSFGIGGKRTPIGTTPVDLAVKGAPGCPAFALMPWLTPITPGHYCLLIEFTWADDANPFNNVGQHNTNVKALNSPHAEFVFPVRNEARTERQIALRVDGYTLPAPPDCGGRPAVGNPRPTQTEVVQRLRQISVANNPKAFPVPEGWTVAIDPPALVLGPEQERSVKVDITAPDGFSGRKTFNVTGFAGTTSVGGVSLTVTG